MMIAVNGWPADRYPTLYAVDASTSADFADPTTNSVSVVTVYDVSDGVEQAEVLWLLEMPAFEPRENCWVTQVPGETFIAIRQRERPLQLASSYG